MAGSSTVRIRSNRHTLVSPPSRVRTVVIAASRWGRSIEGAIAARQTPEWARDPTSTYAPFRGHPHCGGASGSSSQSNWVSSPGRCSITAFGRRVNAGAGLAGRPQRPATNVPGQGLVGAHETQPVQLVQQRYRPEVGVSTSPGGDVVGEGLERVRGRRVCGSRGRGRRGGRTYGLAVVAGASGDLANRDSLPVQSVDVHAAPLESMSVGPPWKAGEWSETTSIQGGPPHATE